mmetsp:Transcript_24873/g.36688  ORF Transcript_24873/g.36688 Transcript_24873/m.36688 type:complete len:143 (+) Transcript_24873:238-666(+)|eukprot:CAMPEP_0185036248 /NCGR_PEP_ID=MMETSP1103-20130426/28939_1 /TAXON_ID=36769 /ORGANISM="Paraphysomonas bandaiensis, Strain Caron Lab Isolate" /LENGTH=142 /DNA_ID=CAMNT_0027573727 /DNA_START=137 /DNA_END=565 /DNA_ORIENTATION=-
MRFVICFIVLCHQLHLLSSEWLNCCPHEDLLGIETVDFTPSRLKMGATAKLHVTGTPVVDIHHAVVSVTVRGPRMFRTRFYESNLCDYVKCPLFSGVRVSKTVPLRIPKRIPAGNYTLRVEIDDTDRIVLASCFEVSSYIFY